MSPADIAAVSEGTAARPVSGAATAGNARRRQYDLAVSVVGLDDPAFRKRQAARVYVARHLHPYLTQKQLAEKLGIHHTTVSTCEAGLIRAGALERRLRPGWLDYDQEKATWPRPVRKGTGPCSFAAVDAEALLTIRENSVVLVALALGCHRGKDGLAWPRIGRLADLTGLSVKTVKRALAKLETYGWWHVVERRRYHATIRKYGPKPKVETPRQPVVSEPEICGFDPREVCGSDPQNTGLRPGLFEHDLFPKPADAVLGNRSRRAGATSDSGFAEEDLEQALLGRGTDVVP